MDRRGGGGKIIGRKKGLNGDRAQECSSLLFSFTSVCFVVSMNFYLFPFCFFKVTLVYYSRLCLMQERCDDIGDAGVIEIKRKAAFNFFCQRRFDEWLEIHSQVKTGI